VKQSIYGFRDAKPDAFLEMKNYLQQEFSISNKKFYSIEWNFSFRLTKNLAKFIDHYFNKNIKAKDLMLEPNHELLHIALTK
jgi:ATP-dependent exoDNAse (exonuclease V) beta subunit